MDQDGGKLTILQRDEGKHGDIIFLFPIKRMVLLAFDKLTFEIFLRCNVFGSKLDFANVFYIYFGSFGYFGVAAPICEKGHRMVIGH